MGILDSMRGVANSFLHLESTDAYVVSSIGGAFVLYWISFFATFLALRSIGWSRDEARDLTTRRFLPRVAAARDAERRRDKRAKRKRRAKRERSLKSVPADEAS